MARRAGMAAAAAVLACLFFAMFLAGPTRAASTEQKQADAREEIERISAGLGKSRARQEAAESEAAAAADREAEYSGLIANGAARAARLAERVTRSAENLDRTRKRLSRARRLLEERLVAIYMGGSPDPVDLVLGSDSFAQLASQVTYLKSITDSDNRLAARVAELRDELSGKVAQLGEAKAAVDEHNAELESARAGIAAARASAETTASRLAAVTGSRESKIASLRASIDTWQRQIEREELARQKAEREALDRQAASQEAEQQVEQNLGGPYSIPTYIVMCESGGNYSALNPSSGAGGAYQIIPSTWEAYGGKGAPQNASKAEQDRIAALIWADSGPGAWDCA